MKYFLDTEFIEGFHKPLFGKRRHFIDLISIGIVSEEGEALYLISNEYNYNDADEWVKENVILPLYLETVSGDVRNSFDVTNFHKNYGVSNKDIAQGVFNFCTQDPITLEKARYYNLEYEDIEFYAYYADYDWVLFCSLFGRMVDLPKGWPMYCKDLKQSFDETYPESTRERIKLHPDYPKQGNEHNALDDAKWNFELYKFIKNT